MNRLIPLAAIALILANGSTWANENNSIQLRDPTRPLSYRVAAPKAGPQLVLQAILQRNSGWEAIVSGERVSVGSAVQGARIESISEQKVVYSYQGSRKTLHLRPQILTRQHP